MHASTVFDVEKTELGLREIDLKDGQICLNGKPILFRGVNRHEFPSRYRL